MAPFVQRVFPFITLLTVVSCISSQHHQVSVSDIDPFHYDSAKTLTVQHGLVVSAHPLASAVGAAILKKGGNAIDAAIATQLALAVVYPGAGNIGGGGFMVARLADGKLLALDYREKAPQNASRDMYLDSVGNALPRLSQDSHLASGVPGTVAGLFASMRYAKLPFSALVQPAIDLAENGFAITREEAISLNAVRKSFEKNNTVTPVFVRSSGRWNAGDTLVQKDLARTLRRIRDKGQAGFYEGETARLIVAEMKRGGGIITTEDLKNYTARWREPHAFDYRGYTILSMPMPSSGGVLINQMLGMIENRPMASYGFHSVRAIQLMTEVERRAFADRAEYMGDPDYYSVPVKQLVNRAYLDHRMADYDSAQAGRSIMIQPGVVLARESDETTHLCVMDEQGNAVSVTTTLNGGYGNRTVVGGAGFLLNNEMDDFSIKPGVPNMYGAVGGEANAIQPGKRMLSSMTPTVVLKNNRPFLVVGTPGGTTIPTSVFQTIVNIIDFGLSPERAVYQPKFHHQWLPDRLDLEAGFPQPVMDSLQKMGYQLYRRGSIGRTELIEVLPDGKMIGVADRRGDDAVAGY